MLQSELICSSVTQIVLKIWPKIGPDRVHVRTFSELSRTIPRKLFEHHKLDLRCALFPEQRPMAELVIMTQYIS